MESHYPLFTDKFLADQYEGRMKSLHTLGDWLAPKRVLVTGR
jgi:hypothetical protein